MAGTSGRPAERASEAAPAGRKELEDAYDEAMRNASRSSFMGALGFGFALFMTALVTTKSSLLGPGLMVEKMLLAGGLAGGFTFTLLALRAGRAVRTCRRLLEERS